jgi:hypothetical protein
VGGAVLQQGRQAQVRPSMAGPRLMQSIVMFLLAAQGLSVLVGRALPSAHLAERQQAPCLCEAALLVICMSYEDTILDRGRLPASFRSHGLHYVRYYVGSSREGTNLYER